MSRQIFVDKQYAAKAQAKADFLGTREFTRHF
jgi:hypothetical protein